MIVSSAKKADIELRLKVLGCMKYALQSGRVEDAKWYGKVSADTNDRINSHDYTQDDAELKRREKAAIGRKRTLMLLNGSDAEFQKIWRQPTDPWGDAMPCFPMYERAERWMEKLIELSTA